MITDVRVRDAVLKISGDPQDLYFNHFVHYPNYIDDITGFIDEYIREDDICVDVGANIGLTTLHMAQLATRGAVLAFEPVPATFEHLERNIAPFADRVRAWRMALGARPGVVAMEVEPGRSAQSRMAPPTAGASVEAPLATLDDMVAGLDRLDLVKIDVEGAEIDVLHGARASLARFRPVCVLEFNLEGLGGEASGGPLRFLAAMFSMFDRVELLDRNTQRRIALPLDRRALEIVVRLTALEGGIGNLVCGFDGARAGASPTLGFEDGVAHKQRHLQERLDRMERDRDHAIYLLRLAEAAGASERGAEAVAPIQRPD